MGTKPKRNEYSIEPKEHELNSEEGRHWSTQTAPVSEQVEAALKSGPMDPADILPFSDINRLMDPGYHHVETGYGYCLDGVQYAACLTAMPGVTAEMIDWWFAWHGLHDVRYRIWFPPGHYGVRVENPDKCRDSRLSYRERYWYNKYTIIEDVGDGPEKLMIVLVPPEQFGFDVSRFHESKVGTIVCANGGIPDLLGGIFAGKICHFVREKADGVEMRSRFWLGQEISLEGKDKGALINRLLNTKLVRRLLPRSAHHLARHCAAEFANLAHLLPRLFPEFRDRF